jgi:hypothetical protein
LDDKEYLEFMITYCVQCAYNVSSTQIYDSISILKDHVEMSKENYNKIWKDIASNTEQSGVNIGTSRRGLCLWQKLENAVNHVMRSISVEDRPGKISIEEEGCTKAIKKAGRCTSHGPKCEEEGCTKTISKAGRCKAHGPKRQK